MTALKICFIHISHVCKLVQYNTMIFLIQKPFKELIVSDGMVFTTKKKEEKKLFFQTMPNHYTIKI